MKVFIVFYDDTWTTANYGVFASYKLAEDFVNKHSIENDLNYDRYTIQVWELQEDNVKNSSNGNGYLCQEHSVRLRV